MELLTKHEKFDHTLVPPAEPWSAVGSLLADTELGVHTVTVFIPLFQNPTVWGMRFPVRLRNIFCTLREAQEHFSGFTLGLSLGWCRDDAVWDPMLRFDVEMEMSREEMVFFTNWKESIRIRFAQREIYVKTIPFIRFI